MQLLLQLLHHLLKKLYIYIRGIGFITFFKLITLYPPFFSTNNASHLPFAVVAGTVEVTTAAVGTTGGAAVVVVVVVVVVAGGGGGWCICGCVLVVTTVVVVVGGGGIFCEVFIGGGTFIVVAVVVVVPTGICCDEWSDEGEDIFSTGTIKKYIWLT